MSQIVKSSTSSPQTSSPGLQTEQNMKKIIKWSIAIAVPLLIVLIPTTESFTPQIKWFFALTFWAVYSMATEIISSNFAAAILPVLYVLFNVAQPAQAFSPWTSTVIWTSFGGIIIASILMTSGLARRIAYFAILKTGGSFTGILIGIMIAGVVINPFVPSVMGKMAMIVPIAIAICDTLDLKPKTRGATAVMMAAFLSIATPRLGYLTGDGGIPMLMGIVANITQQPVTWTQYAFHNLFFSLFFSAVSIALVIIFLKPEKRIEGKEVIRKKYEELGEITSSEKKVVVLLIAAIIALITDSIHKIDAAWIFMFVGLICFLPGVELMNEERLGKLNYKILLFVAGCMSIGTVATACGAGKWMANILFPFLAGSPLYTTVATWFFGVAVNFCLTPMAAIASFTAPITEVCIEAGINPLPVIYAYLQGLDQYILPYEFAGLLFVYSYGYMSMKNMIKVIGPRLILSGVFIALVAYPYWKFIGLY
ncbi:MAG: SLC13 family permease [Clostridia bacterium]|nr:SLC13 family permease [Clostridia bacterium]